MQSPRCPKTQTGQRKEIGFTKDEWHILSVKWAAGGKENGKVQKCTKGYTILNKIKTNELREIHRHSWQEEDRIFPENYVKTHSMYLLLNNIHIFILGFRVGEKQSTAKVKA